MHNRRNYYRILHVQPDAPAEIIRMSYLTLMQRLKMHPDLGGDHAAAALINEAFATLIDPVTRAAYDLTLARDRALPGYRSSREPRASGPSSHVESPVDPFVCAFCGRPFPPPDVARADAVCGFCASPLYPASRHAHEAASRRAMNRVTRRLPVTFYLSWPQYPGLSGETTDLSINGMRLTTSIDLVPNERIKIVCDIYQAVGAVRHARQDDGQAWTIGVEFLTLLISPARGLLISADA